MGKNINHKLPYKQDELPIFQNRMYETKAEPIACPKGDRQLVDDLATGLVYNSQFKSELMNSDSNYQNEQALSQTFKEYLQLVSSDIEPSMARLNRAPILSLFNTVV